MPLTQSSTSDLNNSVCSSGHRTEGHHSVHFLKHKSSEHYCMLFRLPPLSVPGFSIWWGWERFTKLCFYLFRWYQLAHLCTIQVKWRSFSHGISPVWLNSWRQDPGDGEGPQERACPAESPGARPASGQHFHHMPFSIKRSCRQAWQRMPGEQALLMEGTLLTGAAQASLAVGFCQAAPSGATGSPLTGMWGCLRPWGLRLASSLLKRKHLSHKYVSERHVDFLNI